MSDIAIRVEGLSKQYRIGKRERYKTLRDTLTDAVTAPVRRLWRSLSDPDSGREESPSDLIWALKDVSFEVPHGAVVGVIGRNGAGKSTLLKILSRITEPTEGYAEVRGRVGSLLEVGTGFHPELTGRENIYLNGAILGMRKVEVARRFDEIVAFAEVDKFIDTPVKHYSSGMYMRLAFAVAAHLEREILIVDEVLAVGDAAFQEKCLGKMGKVAREGRTVLFVSHNMPAVHVLCTRALLLEGGRLNEDAADPASAIAIYSGFVHAETIWERDNSKLGPSGPIVFMRLSCELRGSQPRHAVVVVCEVHSIRQHAPAFVAFDIADATSTSLMQALPTEKRILAYSQRPRRFEVTIELPPLVPGCYQIKAWIGPHNTVTFDFVESALAFRITESPTLGRTFPHTPDHGFVVPRSTVVVEDTDDADHLEHRAPCHKILESAKG